MKAIVLSTFLSILCVCALADYQHNYGKGHGGGHGIYGYPVGRKWGYSTYIKHPPPKQHGGHGNGYGGQGYGGQGFGGQGYGGQGYGGQGNGGNGFGSQGFRFGGPGFGNSYFPSFGSSQGFGQGHGGGHPGGGQSHTYRHQYIPMDYDAYGFGRKRREDNYGGNNGSPYNSYGQHKNHNYGGGDSYGAHSKTYNTGHSKPQFEDFAGMDSIFGNDFANYLVDLNLPDNFQQLIY